MRRCQSCGTDNQDSSQYCDECGSKLLNTAVRSEYVSSAGFRTGNVTSIGVPAVPEQQQGIEVLSESPIQKQNQSVHAKLIIERGDSAMTQFSLTAEESNIGRWDADNGIFPDVDLDTHDPDAKVSRRHARIIFRNNNHMIEDLGSTNGTFLNRGRRLLPGNPQVLSEGDEIIVGKTFLRFHINK